MRDALETLQETLRDDGSDVDARILLGYATYLADPIAGRQKAQDILSEVVRRDDSRYHAHLYLARILEQEQDRPGALAAYQACLRCQPRHSEARTSAERLSKILGID